MGVTDEDRWIENKRKWDDEMQRKRKERLSESGGEDERKRGEM